MSLLCYNAHMKQETLVLLVVLIVVVLYGWYDRSQLVDELAEKEVARMDLLDRVSLLTTELDQATETNEELRETLEEEQDRLRALGEQVEEVTGTLSDLEKLAELDEELLKKYSKVSFLNENYVPSDLATIRDRYLYDESRTIEIHEEVEDFLTDMLEDALDDDVQLWVQSGYRSFGTQATIKTGYVVTYGAGTANQFSAEQGYSEHQLGTAVDFTTEGLNGALTVGFENTDAFKWLEDNAYRYGFVLSYPRGNAYYQYEPWHWRFVGRDLARYLDRRDLYFYDMDQRDIDEYLLEIFD